MTERLTDEEVQLVADIEAFTGARVQLSPPDPPDTFGWNVTLMFGDVFDWTMAHQPDDDRVDALYVSRWLITCGVESP